MRARLFVISLALGCASKTSTEVPAAAGDSATPIDSTTTLDIGADGLSIDSATFDSRPIETSEFSAFTYSWYGTGASGGFGMNADCGITTRGSLYYSSPRIEGTGVVPAVECDSFKQLSVSPAIVDALRTVDAAGCASDDYPRVTITLDDGSKVTEPGDGCSDYEPYKTLRPRVEDLRRYVDAGSGG